MNQRKRENDHRKYFMVKSARKNVADSAGVEPAPHDQESEAHPTELPRPASVNLDIKWKDRYHGSLAQGKQSRVSSDKRIMKLSRYQVSDTILYHDTVTLFFFFFFFFFFLYLSKKYLNIVLMFSTLGKKNQQMTI